MRVRLIILATLLLVTSTSTARAELYEFTVVGSVEGGFLSVFDLEVGDEITIRYVVDSRDMHPSPDFGQYVGGPARMELPSSTINSSWGNVTVTPLADLLYYQSSPEPYVIQVNFVFPHDTITSDALPLKLPLSLATRRSFFITPGIDPVLYGTVLSYQSKLVPEPQVSCLLLLCALSSRRRR